MDGFLVLLLVQYKHIEITDIAHLTVQFWTNLLHPGGPVGAEQAHGDNKHNYHRKAQPWNNRFFVCYARK